jgi:transforming growth factor-beta-induced protein
MKLADCIPGKAALAGALLALAVTAPAQAGADKSSLPDVVDTAVAAGNFKTLATALQAAGLVETLKGPGPFTVFAPSDEAFAKLPVGTLEALLKDKQRLSAVLTYHVVPGRIMAADVVKMTAAKTFQGSSLAIRADNGVTIDGARVVKADIQAGNGVIHVIDAVLIPRQ